MAFNRLSAWLLTEAGKKFSYFAAGTLAVGLLTLHTLPHTLLLDKYEDFVHLYKKGFTVPLTKKLTDRFNKALDLCEIESIDRPLYKPFAAYGFEVFSAGSAYSRFGVIVGLPANFFYENVDNIDKHLIRLHDDSILWETDEGQQLLKSFILSENAQLYAMAREIKFRQTPKLLIDPFISAVSIAGAYGLSSSINTKMNLYVKPLSVRLILYAIVGTFTFGSYALCKDSTQVYFEKKIDKELIKKNPIFLEGGKEFYEKMLQRNKALRVLLGKEGEKSYSPLGNENIFIRYKTTPLFTRRAIFDDAPKEIA